MESENQTNYRNPIRVNQQTLLKNFHNSGGIFGLMLREYLQMNEREIQNDLAGFDIIESFERSLKDDPDFVRSGTNTCFRWELLKRGHEYSL